MITNDICPCRGCVAPKRHSGCHSVCKEYIEWNIIHQQEMDKVRAKKAETHDIDAIMVQKSIKLLRKRRNQ